MNEYGLPDEYALGHMPFGHSGERHIFGELPDAFVPAVRAYEGRRRSKGLRTYMFRNPKTKGTALLVFKPEDTEAALREVSKLYAGAGYKSNETLLKGP